MQAANALDGSKILKKVTLDKKKAIGKQTARKIFAPQNMEIALACLIPALKKSILVCW